MPDARPLRIRLIGDHSSYHGGSAAAFNVIRAEAARHGEITSHKDDFDVLVVNGEGSMHHGGGGFLKKMREIETALNAGKRAMLVNSVWQHNPSRYADILKGCEQVVVRETLSREALAEQGVRADVALDQSYHEPIDEDAPFHDYKGGVVFTDFWSDEFGSFVALNSKWAQRFPVLDMQAMSWSSIVRSLRTASLLVTGRHHAVYAACRARTPFLAKRGNTHKIEGLIATAGVDAPVFARFEDIKNAVDEQAAPRAECERLFDWMERRAPWRFA